MTSTINVADVERWASALGGAALTAYGIKQLKDRSPAGAALTAAGGALMFRGATGHCPMYAAAGINTADDARRHARGAGRRARDSRGRGRHDQRHGRPALHVLAETRPVAEVHGPPGLGPSGRRTPIALGREGSRPANGGVGRRDHQRSSGRAHRLAHARWRGRGQRRLRALHSLRRETAERRCAFAFSTTRLPARLARRSRGCSGTSRRKRFARTCAASSS